MLKSGNAAILTMTRTGPHSCLRVMGFQVWAGEKQAKGAGLV